MGKRRFLGSLLLAAGLVAACDGGSGGGGSSSGGTGQIDSFITQYCDLYAPCCAKAGKPYDQAKCRLFFTAFSANATYDAAKGQACLDAARAESSGATFCEEGLSDAADDKCDGVFVQGPSGGAKKPGETCENDSECASTAEGEGSCATSFSNETTTKTCQLQVRAKEGEACIGEKDGNATSTSISSGGPPPERAGLCWISDGIFCNDKTKTCAKIQPIGGACDSFDSKACVKEAYCDSTTKLCAARKLAGEPCTGFGDQCAEKHFCDDKTKACAPTIAAGQPCTRSAECEKSSCTNGKCGSGSSATTAFVCVQ